MHLQLDPGNDLPLYAQLARQLREMIAAGQWPPERPLPSVRNLVSLLKVNPQTVLRAFSELEAEGLIERRQGHGTFVVASAVEEAAEGRQQEVLDELRRLAALARQLGIDAGAIADAVSGEQEEVWPWERRPLSSLTTSGPVTRKPTSSKGSP